MKKIVNSTLAFAMISLAVGCNMNKDKTDTTTATDTATTNVTDNMVTNTPAADSSIAKMNTDTIATAKPNPAKKGMKGTASATIPAKKSGSNAEETDNQGYYTNVAPAYPGGERALSGFFQNNIEYPQDAADNGVEGTVEISFLVDETGKISAPMTTGPRLGYGLEEEAMRVFRKMPDWTPGSLKGKNVKTRFTLPVSFRLQ